MGSTWQPYNPADFYTEEEESKYDVPTKPLRSAEDVMAARPYTPGSLPQDTPVATEADLGHGGFLTQLGSAFTSPIETGMRALNAPALPLRMLANKVAGAEGLAGGSAQDVFTDWAGTTQNKSMDLGSMFEKALLGHDNQSTKALLSSLPGGAVLSALPKELQNLPADLLDPILRGGLNLVGGMLEDPTAMATVGGTGLIKQGGAKAIKALGASELAQKVAGGAMVAKGIGNEGSAALEAFDKGDYQTAIQHGSAAVAQALLGAYMAHGAKGDFAQMRMQAPPAPSISSYSEPIGPRHAADVFEPQFRQQGIDAYNQGYRVSPTGEGKAFIVLRPDGSPIGDQKPLTFPTQEQAYAAVQGDIKEQAAAAQKAAQPARPAQAMAPPPAAQPPAPAVPAPSTGAVGIPAIAKQLGVSVSTVKRRIKSGTLKVEKGPDGKVRLAAEGAEKMTPPPTGGEDIDLDAELDSLMKGEAPEARVAPIKAARILKPEEMVDVLNDTIESGVQQATERGEATGSQEYGALFSPGTTPPKIKGVRYSETFTNGAPLQAAAYQNGTIWINPKWLEQAQKSGRSPREINNFIFRIVTHEIAHGTTQPMAKAVGTDAFGGSPDKLNPEGGHFEGRSHDTLTSDVEHLRQTAALDRLARQDPRLRPHLLDESGNAVSADKSYTEPVREMGSELWGPQVNVEKGATAYEPREAEGSPKFYDKGEQDATTELEGLLDNEAAAVLPADLLKKYKGDSPAAQAARRDKLRELYHKYRVEQGMPPATAFAKTQEEWQQLIGTKLTAKVASAPIAGIKKEIKETTPRESVKDPAEQAKLLKILTSPDKRNTLSLPEEVKLLGDIDPSTLDAKAKTLYSTRRTFAKQRLERILTNAEARGASPEQIAQYQRMLDTLKTTKRLPAGRQAAPRDGGLSKEVLAPPPTKVPSAPPVPGRRVEGTNPREIGLSPRQIGTAPRGTAGEGAVAELAGAPALAAKDIVGDMAINDLKRSGKLRDAQAVGGVITNLQGRLTRIENAISTARTRLGERANTSAEVKRAEAWRDKIKTNIAALNKSLEKAKNPPRVGRPPRNLEATVAQKTGAEVLDEFSDEGGEFLEAKIRPLSEAGEKIVAEHSRPAMLAEGERRQGVLREAKKAFKESLSSGQPKLTEGEVNAKEKYQRTGVESPSLRKRSGVTGKSISQGISKAQRALLRWVHAGRPTDSKTVDALFPRSLGGYYRTAILGGIKRGDSPAKIYNFLRDIKPREADKAIIPPIKPGEGRSIPRGERGARTFRSIGNEKGAVNFDELHRFFSETKDTEAGKVSAHPITVLGEGGKKLGTVDYNTGILTRTDGSQVDLALITRRDVGQVDRETKNLTERDVSRDLQPAGVSSAVKRLGAHITEGKTRTQAQLQRAILSGGDLGKGRAIIDPKTGEPLTFILPAGKGIVRVRGGVVFNKEGKTVPKMEGSVTEGDRINPFPDRSRQKTEDAIERAEASGEDKATVKQMREELALLEKPEEQFATDREIEDLTDELRSERGDTDKQVGALAHKLSTESVASGWSKTVEGHAIYGKAGRPTKKMIRGKAEGTVSAGEEGYTRPIALKERTYLPSGEQVDVRRLSKEEIEKGQSGQPSRFALDRSKALLGTKTPGPPRLGSKIHYEKALKNVIDPDFKVEKAVPYRAPYDPKRTQAIERAKDIPPEKQAGLREKVMEGSGKGVSINDLVRIAGKHQVSPAGFEKMAANLFDIGVKNGSFHPSLKNAFVSKAKRLYNEKVKVNIAGPAPTPKSARERFDAALKKELEGPSEEAAGAQTPKFYGLGGSAAATKPGPKATSAKGEPLVESRSRKLIDAGLRTILGGTRDTADIMRSTASSIDLSAPLRQTAIITAAHPIKAAKNIAEMVRTIKRSSYEKLHKALVESPEFKEAQEAGVNFIIDKSDSEMHRGSSAIERLQEKSKILKVGLEPIEASARTYTHYQNISMRDMWRYGKAYLEGEGAWTKQSREELAEFINDAASRTKLKNEGLKKLAAPVFFSPQMIKSRVKILSDPAMFHYNTKAGNFARKQMGLALMTASASALSIYAGLKASGKEPEFEMDPRSSDFGKIRAGSVVVDPWAGYQQYVRTTAQILSGQYKRVSSGKVMKKNRLETAEQFVRSKLAPLPGMGVSMLEGRDVTGRSVEGVSGFTRMVANATAPMTLRDLKDLYKEDPILAVTLGTPVVLGMNVSAGPFGRKENYLDTSALRQADVRVGDEVKRLKLEPPRLSSRVSLNQRNALGQKLYYTLRAEDYENLEKAEMPEVLDSLDRFISSPRYKSMPENAKRRALYNMIRRLNTMKGANVQKKSEVMEELAKGEIKPANDWWK